MLRMKAWLETRWRLLLVFVVPLAALLFRYIGSLGSPQDVRMMMDTLSLSSLFPAIYLAGAGISTQSALRETKGLHGSLYFTLSLPVSRFRLVAVRAGIGFLEFAGITAVTYSAAWMLLPVLRGSSKPVDLLELILAATVCSAGFYFVSVLLATFLEPSWQIVGSMLFYVASRWLANHLHLPSSFELLSFVREGSPLLTHRLPWGSMAISVCLSMILFSAALKIVQAREY